MTRCWANMVMFDGIVHVCALLLFKVRQTVTFRFNFMNKNVRVF